MADCLICEAKERKRLGKGINMSWRTILKMNEEEVADKYLDLKHTTPKDLEHAQSGANDRNISLRQYIIESANNMDKIYNRLMADPKIKPTEIQVKYAKEPLDELMELARELKE